MGVKTVFVETLTGRTCSLDVSGLRWKESILIDRLKAVKFLPKEIPYHISGNLADIPAEGPVRLVVDGQEALERTGAGKRFYSKYHLFFKWRSGAMISQVEATLPGYFRRCDALRMVEETVKKKHPAYFESSYLSFLTDFPWTEEYLCQWNPPQGEVIWLDLGPRYLPEDDGGGFPCIYGCPTAAMPHRQEELSRKTVEIVDYD